jgi:hypothetical protein
MVGFAVVTTVVFVGVAVVAGVALVVCAVVMVVVGVTLVVCAVVMVVVGVTLVVCVVATVVVVVVLEAPTGNTMRSIAKNTAIGITDDPYPRDIQNPLPAGFTVDFQ